MSNGDILRQNPGTTPLDVERALSIISRQYLLLDAVNGVDVGWWMPWSPFHNASIELSGTFVATGQILLSNAPKIPANGYTVTVAGSVTPGDILTVNVLGQQFPNGLLTASYTVKGGDTTTTIATGLTSAITAAIKAADNVVSQESSLSSPGMLAGSLNVASLAAVITIFTQTVQPWFNVTTAKSGGSTETLTVAQYDDGSGTIPTGLNALSSAGMTQINLNAQWIKAKCSAFTSGLLTIIASAASP